MSGILRRTAVYMAVAIVLLCALAPMYQMLMVSFTGQSEILNSPFFPSGGRITLDNYRALFGNGVVNLRIYANSLVVAVGVSVAATTLSILAGYALARFRFPGRTVIDRGVLLAYIIPPTLLLVPIYSMMVALRLDDTLIAVGMAQLVLALPFAIWLLRGFLRDIPAELDEAARIDGCSHLGVLIRIVLPLALPGIATVAIFAFLESWNEFLFASVLVTSPEQRTYPFGLYAVAGTYGDVRWGEAMAAATLGAIPVFILFLVFQKWIVSGLTSGAVKG